MNNKRPAASPAAVTPNRLLGMMDKAKSFPLLAANYPQAVADVEVAQPGTPTDYPQFVVTVDEVYRFPQADTLVFKLTFKNKTAERLGSSIDRLQGALDQTAATAEEQRKLQAELLKTQSRVELLEKDRAEKSASGGTDAPTPTPLPQTSPANGQKPESFESP